MAKYGAKYIQWAPFAAADSDINTEAFPKYGEPMNLGALNQVTDSPVFNEARLPGDNNPLQEYVSEFKECTVDITVTELANAVAAAVLGASLGDTESPDLSYGAEDSAPYGGLAFYINKMVDGVKFYQGIYYPKAKAAPQGNSYATKGDSITLVGDVLHLVAAAPTNGKWKVQSANLSTEAAAKAWVDSMIVAAT